MMTEKINPDYYKNKGIETIDAILSQLSFLEAVGYLRGSALKYQMRFGEKHGATIDVSLTDIGKSNWYQEKLMKYLNDAKKQGLDFKEILPKGCENIEQLFKDKNK